MRIKDFMQAGHAPTLFSAFLYFDMSFMVWVVLGPLGVHIARDLGLEIFVHNANYGYGANQKTCYREALRAQADIIVMVHPDYQYDPTLLPEMIRPIQDDRADVVFGSRLSRISDWAARKTRGVAKIFLGRSSAGLHPLGIHSRMHARK